jgi:hypothetical protein
MLSGAETPEDPRAPAAKTAMKMQVTNMRIEDKIIRLQYADAQVVRKVEKIIYGINDKYDYWNKGEEKKVDKKVYSVPVRYVMHGSRMTFSRQIDLQLTLQFIDILGKLSPASLKEYPVIRVLLDTVINDSGGSIKKSRDIILEQINNVIEMQAKVAEVKRLMAEQGQEKQEGQTQPVPDMGQGAGIPNTGGMPQSGMPTGSGESVMGGAQGVTQ